MLFHTAFLLFLATCGSSTSSVNLSRLPNRLARSDKFPTNICETFLNSPRAIRCQCDITDEALAEDLDCWITETIEEDDQVWNIFDSQENAMDLKIQLKSEGYLNFVPTKALTLLSELKTLNMYNTNIKVLPPNAFGKHHMLSSITLNNSVEVLEESAFSNLSELTVIDISKNKIWEINRKVFHDLPMLEELNLSQNSIKIVHDYAFKEVPRLLKLDLSKNTITVLTPEVFYGLSVLENLDLFENQITHIGPKTFESLPDLTYLDLTGNKIASLDNRAFYGLSKLRILRLGDNQVATVPPGILQGLAHLTYLDISRNQLKALPENVFSNIYDNLKVEHAHLRVDNNPLDCDCDTLWLLRLKSSSESHFIVQHLGRLLCNFKGKLISIGSLKSEEICTMSSPIPLSTSISSVTEESVTQKDLTQKTTESVDGIPTVILPDHISPRGVYHLETESSSEIVTSFETFPSNLESSSTSPEKNLPRHPSTRPPLPTVRPRNHDVNSKGIVPLFDFILIAFAFLFLLQGL